MNRRRIVFVMLMACLFLFGNGQIAVANPEARISTINKNLISNKTVRYYQKKRPPVESSLIKPSVNRNQVRDQVYRHNQAREAMRSGRIASLSVIRKRVKQSFPGKILDVTLLEPKKKNRPYIYMMRVLRKDGKLLILTVNAKTGKIISVKGNG